MAFSKDTRLFILMMDATIMQATMLKDHPAIKQFVKQKFNRFFNEGRWLSRQLSDFAERRDPSIEDAAALVYEAMQEICNSKDPAMALALLKEFNNGNVEVTE